MSFLISASRSPITKSLVDELLHHFNKFHPLKTATSILNAKRDSTCGVETTTETHDNVDVIHSHSRRPEPDLQADFGVHMPAAIN